MTEEYLLAIEERLHFRKPAARERIKQLIAEVRRERALSEERRRWMEEHAMHACECEYQGPPECSCGLDRLTAPEESE